MGILSRNRVTRTLLVVLLLSGLVILIPIPGQAAQGPPRMLSADVPMMELRKGDRSGGALPRSDQPLPDLQGSGASFYVTYVGNWNADARAAFQHAANIWSTRIDATVPMEIVAHWESSPDSFLVRGGPTRVFSNFDGAPVADSWYPVTLANQLANRDLLPDRPDIDIILNSSYSWYLGTDGNVPSNQFDLVTSVLGGLGFGLGEC